MKKEIKELLNKHDAEWRFPGSVLENFRALSAIAKYDKSLLSGGALGKIIAGLVEIEKEPGGPYYSQFSQIGLKTKGRIDAETNRAIAEFLALYDIFLPNLAEYGKEKKFSSLPSEINTAKKGRPPRSGAGIRTGRPEISAEEKKTMSGIRFLLEKRLSSVPASLRAPARRAFWKTVRGNPDKQMPLIGYFMKESLGKSGKKAPARLAEEIGLLNSFFWSAFIIYDDFWDKDEAADPVLLPVANMFSRAHAEFFRHPPCLSGAKEKSEYGKFFSRVMNELDAANCWELERCRARVSAGVFHIPEHLPPYGDYSKKYEPASGHILGPILLLALSGRKVFGEEARNLELCFKHLLIAMQLLDDMHDLEEDMKRGHISTAAAALLQELPPEKKEINLKKEMPELKRIFWFSVVPKLSKEAVARCRRARRALMAIRAIENPVFLEKLIFAREKAAREALVLCADSAAFIKSCRSQS